MGEKSRTFTRVRNKFIEFELHLPFQFAVISNNLGSDLILLTLVQCNEKILMFG